MGRFHLKKSAKTGGSFKKDEEHLAVTQPLGELVHWFQRLGAKPAGLSLQLILAVPGGVGEMVEAVVGP